MVEGELADHMNSSAPPMISNSQWDVPLWIGHRGSCYIYSISQTVTGKLSDYIKDNLDVADYTKISASFHIWDHNSGINWHNDTKYVWGATVYLNKTWNEDWGGIFRWRDGEDENEIAPIHNLMVINDVSQMHMVTPINNRAEQYRTSLQIFAT